MGIDPGDQALTLLPVLGGCSVSYYSRETAQICPEVLLVKGSDCEHRKAETIHKSELMVDRIDVAVLPVRVHHKADLTSI